MRRAATRYQRMNQRFDIAVSTFHKIRLGTRNSQDSHHGRSRKRLGGLPGLYLGAPQAQQWGLWRRLYQFSLPPARAGVTLGIRWRARAVIRHRTLLRNHRRHPTCRNRNPDTLWRIRTRICSHRFCIPKLRWPDSPPGNYNSTRLQEKTGYQDSRGILGEPDQNSRVQGCTSLVCLRRVAGGPWKSVGGLGRSFIERRYRTPNPSLKFSSAPLSMQSPIVPSH